jgi:prepilin-type N-terminal cleavage/methylation domain-containing protein
MLELTGNQQPHWRNIMSRFQRDKRGFTLVELLVVIAIIGILAGFLVPTINRARDAAKVANVQNTLNQMRTTLATYLVDHKTYPPAYGYMSKAAFNEIADSADRLALDPTDPANAHYFITESYMSKLGLHGIIDMYDPFSNSSDTDGNGVTSRLEYFPQTGSDNSLAEYSNAVIDEQRPFVYIPVNLRQFRRIKDIWDQGAGSGPTDYRGFPDFTNSKLQSFSFPPASYDAFAIVSVGLVENTQGLIYDVGNAFGNVIPGDYVGKENYYYHIAALATYYMLTRDIDGDGVKDFDYIGRKSLDQDGNLFPHFPRTDADGDILSNKIGNGIDGPIYLILE